MKSRFRNMNLWEIESDPNVQDSGEMNYRLLTLVVLMFFICYVSL